MNRVTRVLMSLILAAVLAVPIGAAQNPDASSEPSSCESWKSEAQAKIDAFWADHKARWQALVADLDRRAESFYESERSAQEEQQFWGPWNDELHKSLAHYHDEAERHRQDMAAGYRTHCGDENHYQPAGYEYPFPYKYKFYEERRAQWANEGYQDPHRPTTAPPPEYHDDYKGEPREPHHAEPAYGYSDECRAYDDERRQAAERLHEEFRRLRDEMDQERRAYYSSSGNRTAEDDQRFEEKMREWERELRLKEQEAFRQLEEQYGNKQDCHPPMAQGARSMPAECDWSYMESAFREFEDRLREQENQFFRLQEEKWRNLEARMESQRREFESSGDHTESEWQDFDRRMEEEWRRAEERIHEEEGRFFDKQQAERDKFRVEQESRCYGGPGPGPDGGHRGPPPGMHGDFERRGPGPGGPGPGGPHRFDAAHEEMEIERLQCQLDVKIRMKDMMRQMDEAYRRYQESGEYPSPSEMEEMEIKRLEAEIEIRKAMLECEKKIREAWDSQIRTELEDARPHERMGSWSMSEDPDTGEVHLRGKFVTIKGDATTSTLKEVAVTGQVWINGIATDSYFEDEGWNMGEGGHGSWLTGSGPGVQMRLHDNPSGLIRFQSEDGYSFLITLPDYVEVSSVANGFALTSNGASALLRAHHDQAAWDESSGILTVSGKAEFLVPDSAKNYVLEKVANKHRDEINDAFEDRQLGGEVTFTADEDGEVVEETLVYDDVEITIEEPEEKDTVEVIVSSDSLEEGKTFVLNLDNQLLSVHGSVDVAYADIDEETGEETPVAIQKASGLSDILDANDDDGPEYWVVMDEDGVQVLVSVPNWSTHKITVQGREGGDSGSVPAPGLGLVGITALLAAIFVARRRRDE